MTRFSIKDAAKRVGIDRKTIYKHIKKGRVSAKLDESGQKYIDAAELHRAYPDLKPLETGGDSLATNGDTLKNAIGDTEVTGIFAEMVEELRQLKQEVKQLREEVARRPLLGHQPKAIIDLEKPDNITHDNDKSEPTFKSIIRRMKEKQNVS